MPDLINDKRNTGQRPQIYADMTILLFANSPNSEFSLSPTSSIRTDLIVRSTWVAAMDLGCSTCSPSLRSFMDATNHTG